jgi:cytochrome c oxidase subunit II
VTSLRASGLAIALGEAAVLTACHGQPSAMSPAGPQAASIEWLWWVIFWIAAAVYVIVLLTYSRAATRNSSTSAAPEPIIKEPDDRRAGIVVAAAVAVTVLTLFAVLGLSVTTGNAVANPTSKNPITIQVTGHQWWWEITYPNPQADQTVVTANEIHVPVGKPVVVLTRSADVIHSFWAPNLNGKRDLLPGYQTAFWFQADKPGIYHGQCAEFCGWQHAHMGFAIIAEPADKFMQWEQQQVKPATESSNPEVKRGRDVFLNHACVLCHTIRGTSAGSRMGPDLTHLASRRMIAAETLPNTRGALAGWILDPQRVKPGNHMAPNPMQPDELQALLAYLQSLQ